MKLLKAKNNQCLIYAAAMVFDVEPDSIIKYIGHDGSARFQSGKLVGVHIQEIQDFAFSIDHGLALIEPRPYIGYDYQNYEPVWEVLQSFKKLNEKLTGNKAIIIHDNHAVAWDGFKVYDPKGHILPMIDRRIREVWIDLILKESP